MSSARGGLAAALLLLAGCAPLAPQVAPDVNPLKQDRCDEARPAPLLDGALAGVGLQRGELGISRHDLLASPYAGRGILDDAATPALVTLAFESPWQLGCAHDALVARLDRAAADERPATGLLREMAALLGAGRLAGSEPAAPSVAVDFSTALAGLCGKQGCGPPRGHLPGAMEEALAPVLAAAAAVAEARRARFEAAGLPLSIAWDSAPGNVYRQMFGATMVPPYDSAAALALLKDEAAEDFHSTAIALARAVEQARLERFAHARGIAYDLLTPLGRIRVRDAAAHRHDDAAGPYLLLLDLGGDDRYLGASAATRPGYPVSILVDLAGDDDYGYPGVDAARAHRLLLPDDGHGRASPGLPRSRSQTSRQAAARDGVALLFDLAGDDRYRSPVQSQGYAALGVAALLDGGGDDLYEAELLAQGAAVHGLAVAADLGAGRDRRLAFSGAQGFAHVGGAALLYDDGGDDEYHCPHGRAADGGLPLYPTSQMLERGNLSFCQGAAFGIRGDATGIWRPGGVGILRDRAGNDRYAASVYAQGVGYWQGAGLLADGGGDDRYDGDWYVQGAAAHYALGFLADAGGDDVYGGLWPTSNMQGGAGHDFSVGMLVDESGDDRFHLTSLSAGASNCNGRGFLVDNRGDDRYETSSELGLGLGAIAPECRPRREGARSIGLMLDAGGRDGYTTPGGERPLPAEGRGFGYSRDGLALEYGVGRDGEGESGLHVAAP